MAPKDIEQRIAEIRSKTLWSFSDLKAQGIVNDRATLRRREAREGFPQAAVILSSNSVAWNADEVRAWLASRPRGLDAAAAPHEDVAAERSKVGIARSGGYVIDGLPKTKAGR